MALSRQLREAMGRPEPATGPEPLVEFKMIGFRAGAAGRRHTPDVIARIKAHRKYVSGTGETRGKLVPTVEVWVSKDGKKAKWLASGAFHKALEPLILKAMEKEGAYPKKGGYTVEPESVGLAEIGQFHVQNPYSDDAYLAVRADSDAIAKLVIEAFKKVVKPGGGGVVGSSSYKAHGTVEGGSGEYTYHYNSFGIGD